MCFLDKSKNKHNQTTIPRAYINGDMETSDLSCLVCNTKLEVTSCVNIFYTSLPRNGTQLSSFILQVLRCLESDLRSSYVCSQCYSLFQMLEQAQWTAANIRTEILKVYESSGKRKEVRTHSANETQLIDLDDKCFSHNLTREDKIKITNTISQLKNISTGLRTSDEECGESSVVHANLDQCVSKIFNKGAKLNVGDSIAPVSLNDSKDAVNQRDRRKFLVQIQKSHVANETINQNQEILEEGSANPSERNGITANLNRQEKMALYTHQCRVCGRLFKDANDLHSHSLKHGGTRPYKCRICKDRFPSVSAANLHAVQEHPRVKDAIIIASEPREGELDDFINDNHGLFPDELLGMSDNEERDDFEWKEAVRNDDKMTDNEDAVSRNEPTQTPDVGKQVMSNSQKATNKSGGVSKYSLKPLKHSCPTCGKKWRTSAELKTHLKSHSNLRPYMCEKCGQAYKHKHALEIHVGMHNGINPFQCSFCNKCFTQKGALMRHLPMHTGETPYQCELCGKRFVHHTSYNMHALSHTGKKSYQCHVCDLSLLSTSHLKRHMRVHTGEKPYSCTLCGKRFAERYNLFAHQKIHDPAEILAKETKKIQYKCKECAILFDKKQKLDDHLRQHHNVATESTSNRKWVSNGNDVETPISTFCTSENENENQNGIKVDVRDNITVDQAWQHIGYTKLESIESEPKLSQSQNAFQIATNPLTVALENHKMLMDMGCNRNLIANLGLSSGSQIPMERTQI